MENWTVQRSMSADEYERALVQLRLNKASAARLLGCSERTSRRYANGESQVPPAFVLLLRAFQVLQIRPFVPKLQRKQM